MKKLIPVDKVRCQGESRTMSFMSIGIPPFKRCENKPSFIASIIGKRGKMSVCGECKITAKRIIKNVRFVKL